MKDMRPLDTSAQGQLQLLVCKAVKSKGALQTLAEEAQKIGKHFQEAQERGSFPLLLFFASFWELI